MTVLSAVAGVAQDADTQALASAHTSARGACFAALQSGNGGDDVAMNISFLPEQAEMAYVWGAGLSYDFPKWYTDVYGMSMITLIQRWPETSLVVTPLEVCQHAPGIVKMLGVGMDLPTGVDVVDR